MRHHVIQSSTGPSNGNYRPPKVDILDLQLIYSTLMRSVSPETKHLLVLSLVLLIFVVRSAVGTHNHDPFEFKANMSSGSPSL